MGGIFFWKGPKRTLRPTMTTLPSRAHAIVSPSPPSCTVAMQDLLRTSQNLHVPSLETEASSASLTGFHATRSMPPVCPLSSVLFFTCDFSGFQMRRVRSADPVAMRWPVGFQAMVRMLEGGFFLGQLGTALGRGAGLKGLSLLTCESLGRGRRDRDRFRSLGWRIGRRNDLSLLVFGVEKVPC